MRHNKLRYIFLMAAMCGIAAGPVADIASLPLSAQQKTTPARKRKAKDTGNKAAAKSKKNNPKSQRPETSADVKRRQEATQKEIRQTEAQIKENEKSVKKGLNELGKLEGDISASKGKIANTTSRIASLNGQISDLEKSIASNESELKRMREEYLKALKKMRLSKKKTSGLAFVFASENFNQALRRMRYLRQFSEWRDRQSAAIDSKNAQLKSERENLGKARREHDAVLKLQQSEQAALSRQYAKQDALVMSLKKNGDALKTHLSKKQAEVNELRSRIASLIAEEEKKAAEERARQEAARKAEEERLAREEAARIAEEKALAETAANEEEINAHKAEENKNKTEENRKQEKERKRKQKKDNKKTEQERKEPKKTASQQYADARKRTPRRESESKSSSASVGSGNFGSMKGSLPRPVSGAFKVTSRFGRQSFPDLPDVVYDNPGIDAEVSTGSSALAVYGGKVSGLYVVPGYNTVVIVSHGNYYTVYGNISAASVKVGDKVNAGQSLGRLAPDEDDNSRSAIHFEVWRNREKLNPLEWIKYN